MSTRTEIHGALLDLIGALCGDVTEDDRAKARVAIGEFSVFLQNTSGSIEPDIMVEILRGCANETDESDDEGTYTPNIELVAARWKARNRSGLKSLASDVNALAGALHAAEGDRLFKIAFDMGEHRGEESDECFRAILISQLTTQEDA